MRILPVLDLQGGVVVRGVAGRRHEYRPLASRLTRSTQPLDVARALRAHLGLEELYVADLDAIAAGPQNLALYDALCRDSFVLWLDAGVRRVEQARALAGIEGVQVVVGLETVAGPDVLVECVRELGDRVVFSLDLRDGEPLGDRQAWEGGDALAIAERAIVLGVRRLLVLDLARVGMGRGTGTEEVCRRLAAGHPEITLAAGGGVNGRDDLERLRGWGVGVALVASALHDGRL
jgi:phosphoribosylformimino-5-aminoimidazole carboxamide ribotide isomerase